MIHTKKMILVLILPLVVVSGLVFANRKTNNHTRPAEKSPSCTQPKAPLSEKELWEASPAGIKYKEWEHSPAGKKVHASYDKIEKYLTTFTDMEATVTSVTFQRGDGKTPGPKWLLARINGEDYMMQFSPADFQQLKSLKVNDKIIIKSRSAGYSPNHPYLIVSGDYISLNNKILFKRDFSKNKGC